MPARLTPLITGQIYHLCNRSIERKPIFIQKRAIERAREALRYYRFDNVPVKLSYFLSWSKEKQQDLLLKMEEEGKRIVEVICYCFMPNHFHILLKQEKDEGISRFLSLFQNSFSRYFNTIAKRSGHLFQGQFRAVRIETEEQFMHISRYIHLNPYSAFVIKRTEELFTYPWSSFPEYLGLMQGFCSKEIILAKFKTVRDYQKFVFDQADYQRDLEKIKHLSFEEE